MLTLATMHDLCIVRPALALPPRDVLGVLNGAAYRHDLFKPLRKYRYGCAGVTNDLVGGRPLVFLGNKLPAIDLLLKLNPYVYQVRCNYPVVMPRRLLPSRRSARADEAMPILIDRMLTVEMKAAPGYPHLHALFLREDKMSKVAALLYQHCVTVEVISMDQFSRLDIQNAAQCYQWLLGSDIRVWAAEAKRFAAALQEMQRRQRGREPSLDRRMEGMTSLFQCDRNHAYCLLGTAIAYGFVEVEKNCCLAITRPLRLVQTGDRS